MKLLFFSAMIAAATLSQAQISQWENEIVYQIFPRSYRDSNGDHVGDFRGITQELGFIHELGFTAILINPIFESRFYHNYFADNFLKADPKFGTNRDFFELVRQAHAKKMKVILDMEVQYVADLHPWFRGMRDARSPYAGFIWRDGSRLFGDMLPGYDGQTIGFATLNPDNRILRAKVFDIFRYWAAPDDNPGHGVDGFRIDHMMDDLDSEHVKTGMLTNFWLPIETGIRSLNPKIFFLAEQSDWGLGADIFRKAKVDSVYAIPLRNAWITFDKSTIERAIAATYSSTPQTRTQVIFIENHDVERYASVVKRDPDLMRLGALFNLTLKGTPMVYYGQELGMAGIQGKWRSDANDIPVRLAYRWTKKVEGKGSADFYRGSGPWAKTGFVRDGDGVSVEEEIPDPGSLINFYKRLTHLRVSLPALRTGSISLVEGQNSAVLAYERKLGRQKIRIYLNLSDARQSLDLPSGSIAARDLWTGKLLGKRVQYLKPHDFLVVDVSA